jgi:hypothetical protein
MSETWYWTRKYDDSIETVEVVKETPQGIVYLEKTWNGGTRESRSRKVSEYYRFFKTFKEAKNYLIERLENSINSHKESIEEKEKKLLKVRAMESA